MEAVLWPGLKLNPGYTVPHNNPWRVTCDVNHIDEVIRAWFDYPQNQYTTSEKFRFLSEMHCRLHKILMDMNMQQRFFFYY